MLLAVAMLVSYLPFLAWIFAEARRQNIESQKTH